MTAESWLGVPDSATLEQYSEYRLMMLSPTFQKDCSSGINQIIFGGGPVHSPEPGAFAYSSCSVIQIERLVPSFEEDRQKYEGLFH